MTLKNCIRPRCLDEGGLCNAECPGGEPAQSATRGGKLLECPFCGAVPPNLISDFVLGSGCNRKFIRCLECHAQGPWSTKVIDQESGWDCRRSVPSETPRMTTVEFCGKPTAAPCAIEEQCQYGADRNQIIEECAKLAEPKSDPSLDSPWEKGYWAAENTIAHNIRTLKNAASAYGPDGRGVATGTTVSATPCREALAELERAATVVHQIGARTGGQWVALAGALLSARLALKNAAPPEPVSGEDGERYRWFRNECSWARRSDIVDVAAEEPDMLDHHIDKGRCGL